MTRRSVTGGEQLAAGWIALFRAGGPSRWFAILLAVGVVGYALWRPQDTPRSGDRVPSSGPTATTASPATAAPRDAPPPLATDTSSSVPSLDDSAARDARVPTDRVPGAGADATRSDGVLTPMGDGRLRSPAGLVYARGSQQGHRIRHVMTHTQDEPDRPGQHGVFGTTEQDDVVALIDRAYRMAASRDRRVRRTEEEGRTVLTVDLGEVIGYVGGQSGQRRNHPSARHLRLVLEGDRVITAYPVIP